MSPTPPKPKDNLVSVATRLSRAAANTWPDFIVALEEYVRERELACVQAPADKVLIAQGMARQCQELLTLLRDQTKQK